MPESKYKKGEMAKSMKEAKKAADDRKKPDWTLPLHPAYKGKKGEPAIYKKIRAAERKRIRSGKSELAKGQESEKGQKKANIFGRVFGETEKAAAKKKKKNNDLYASASKKKNG